MTDKLSLIEQARQLATTTTISVDLILQQLDLDHRDYRKVYPDTKVTPGLALDIQDARDRDGLTLEQIKCQWYLNNSQLYFALYNDNALNPKDDNTLLVKNRIIAALRHYNGKKSQTDIAEEYGVSQSYVHLIAKELNMLPDRKKRVVLNRTQRQDILNIMRERPLTRVTDLAKQYGVSRDTIYKLLQQGKA